MNLIAALNCMVALIDSGVEYPDAHYCAAKKFKVDATALQIAYDTYCFGILN
jgi:hypothetical protein